MPTFNQFIKKQEKEKKKVEKLGVIPRGINAANKELASMADSLLNALPDTNSFLPEGLRSRPLRPKNSVENLLRGIGAIKDISPAETYGEKRAESYGHTVGSLAPLLFGGGAGLVGRGGMAAKGLASTLFGVNKPIKSISDLGARATAGTLGSAIGQAEAQPKLEEVFPENPLVQGIGSIVAGTLGGTAGSQLGRLGLPKSISTLPLRTAAQLAPENTPQQRKLIARENALAQSPKSAEKLNKVFENQDASIYSQLNQAVGKINPRKVSADLKEFIKDKVTERSEAYKKGLTELEKKWNQTKKSNPDARIGVEKALTLTDDLLEQSANGSGLQKSLLHVKKLIENNTHSFSKLKNAVTDLNTGPDSKLVKDYSLAKQDATLIRNIKNSLMEDIDTAIPGYNKLSQEYAEKSSVLNKILNGSVGKVGKKAERSPSTIYDNIFEKTDPLEIEPIKEALGTEKFKEATRGYLGQLLKKGEGETPSKTLQNVFKRLDKNKNILEESLPEDIKSKIYKLQKEYHGLSATRPREGFLQEAYNIAEQPSNFDILTPHAGAAVAKKSINPLTRNLKLNEAMTGITPLDQISEQATKLGAKSIPIINTAVGEVLPPDALPVEEDIIEEPVLIEQPESVSSVTLPSPRGFNAWLEAQESQEKENPSSKRESKGFNTWLEKQEGTSKKSGSQPEKKKRQSLEEIAKRLHLEGASLSDLISKRESGGNPRAVNKLGYLGEFQFGARALEDIGLIKAGASKNGANAQVLANPANWTLEGGREAFLSDPNIQRQAMTKYMALNKSRLKSAGLIRPSTPSQDINGMIAAAHLGGIGGVKNLMKGRDAKDALGTPVSEYYKLGRRHT